MATRLVVGCGTLAHPLISSFAGRGADLYVIDDDEDRVEGLRYDNVPAELADPTDPEALRVDGAVDVVVVGGNDVGTNLEAARVARSVHPAAVVIAFAGVGATPDDRARLADVADRVLDRGTAVVEALEGALLGDAGRRLGGLNRLFRSLEGPLGVFTHDNPDPDAIASAVALCDLARAAGLEAEACHFGQISHQENRAFVNLLDLDLNRLDGDFDPDDYGAIALVDHSRPGVNDQLPPETPIDVVIDHHPPRASIEATYVDLRTDVGATSTLLTEYYRSRGLPVDETVATALLYGIRIDTRDFGREIDARDFGAAAFLSEWADHDALTRIESPSITGDTLDTIARAIANRIQRGSILVSGVGTINDRDTLSQASDQLLAMAGVSTTVVFGYTGGTVYISARTRGTDLDIGEALRQAFDQIGSAGGHDDMAGAQLPMGILGTVEEGEEASIEAIINEVIANRFFEVLGLPRVVDPPVFDPGADVVTAGPPDDADGPDAGAGGGGA